MRILLILGIAGPLALCGPAHAASDPVKFCGGLMGKQIGTPEYAECARILANLDAEAVRQGYGTGAAQSSHVILDVTYDPEFGSEMPSYLKFQSHEDRLTMTGIRVNRGNCPLLHMQLPVTLKFGQRIGWMVPYGCHPIEVEVSTDKGSYTAVLTRR